MYVVQNELTYNIYVTLTLSVINYLFIRINHFKKATYLTLGINSFFFKSFFLAEIIWDVNYKNQLIKKMIINTPCLIMFIYHVSIQWCKVTLEMLRCNWSSTLHYNLFREIQCRHWHGILIINISITYHLTLPSIL